MENLKSIDPNHNSIFMPFHGDTNTLKIVKDLMNDTNKFIETGTGWGDTILYMANEYPGKTCISCETDTDRFNACKNLLSNHKNAKIYNVCSTDLLENHSNSNNDNVIFWLDAHGSFVDRNGIKIIVDPVREELDNIFHNYKDSTIFIDDFQNPFGLKFSYDVLKGGNILGINYIKHLIPKDYNIYAPYYKNRVCLEPCQTGVIGVGWCIITKKDLSYDFLKKI